MLSGHLVRSTGSLLRARIDEIVTPEAVRDSWDKVTDMSSAVRMESIGEASGALITAIEETREKSQSSADGVSYKKKVWYESIFST